MTLISVQCATHNVVSLGNLTNLVTVAKYLPTHETVVVGGPGNLGALYMHLPAFPLCYILNILQKERGIISKSNMDFKQHLGCTFGLD